MQCYLKTVFHFYPIFRLATQSSVRFSLRFILTLVTLYCSIIIIYCYFNLPQELPMISDKDMMNYVHKLHVCNVPDDRQDILESIAERYNVTCKQLGKTDSEKNKKLKF